MIKNFANPHASWNKRTAKAVFYGLGAVRTETVEHGTDDFLGFGGKVGIVSEAGVRDIIVDADGEVILRLRLSEVVEDSLDHGGSEFLRGEAVASTDDAQIGPALFVKGVDAIEEQGFATGAGFLGAIEDGQGFDLGGKRLDKTAGIERPIEADLEHTDLFALGVEVIDGLVGGFATGTHEDDDALGVGSCRNTRRGCIGVR